MEEGRYEQACADLRESFRLDRAGGTQLTLAICYERAGKFASAWLAYLEALAFAQRDGRRDREKIAREQATKMEAKAPHVVVHVPAEVAALPEATIFVDETALERSGWETNFAVDPGSHKVRATAKGYLPWSKEFSVRDAKDRAEVTVAMLEKAPASLVTASPQVAPSTGAKNAQRGTKRAPVYVRPCPTCPAPKPPPSQTRNMITALSGGAGLALLATGTVFGIAAIYHGSQVCERADCPPYDEQPEHRLYKMSALTANVTIGLGIAFTGLSAILLATRPSTK